MNDFLETLHESHQLQSNNPGKIKVNKLSWILHYPLWPLFWIGGLLFFIALSLLIHWGFWFLVAFFMFTNWVYWMQVDDRFENGDSTPSIIVNLDPMLIAVSSDLTKGYGSYPIIKIIEKEVPNICGREPQLGMKLATVSLYRVDFKNKHRWKNIDPRPIDCVCDNIHAKQRILESFTADEWQELIEKLKQIPQPYECGLYPIEPWDDDPPSYSQ